MKILVIAGAAESLIGFRLPLLKEMVARDHQVIALAPDITPAIAQKLASERIVCESTPLSRTGNSFFSDFRYVQTLREKIQKHSPDAVFAYTHKPIVYGIPVALEEGVGIRVAFITGLGYAFIAKGWKRTFISSILKILYRRALRAATSIKFQNPDDVADFKKMGLLSCGQPYQIVGGSGVPLHDYPPTPVPPHTLRFLMLSRLLGDKGVREYVQAARIVRHYYPDAKFILAGEIDSNPASITQKELSTWIEEGVVQFLGKLKDVRDELAKCSVYVLPSYREGTPRSVLEAMATGRAIVTTDAPGCRETIRNASPLQGELFKLGDNGLLVNVADVKSLSSALLYLCRSPSLICEMASASRDYVAEKYDVNKVNKDLLEWSQN